MVSATLVVFVCSSVLAVTGAASICREVHPVAYIVKRPTKIVMNQERYRFGAEQCSGPVVDGLLYCQTGQLTDGDICERESRLVPTEATNSCWLAWHLKQKQLNITFKFDEPKNLTSITVHTLLQHDFMEKPIRPFKRVSLVLQRGSNTTSIKKRFVLNHHRKNDGPHVCNIDIEGLWAENVTMTLSMGRYTKLALSEVTFMACEPEPTRPPSCCNYTDTANRSRLSAETHLTTAPSNQTTCPGSNVTFVCNTTDPKLYVQWHKLVTLSSNIQYLPLLAPSNFSSILTIYNVGEEHSGSYVCKGYNRDSCFCSVVNLTVLQNERWTSNPAPTSEPAPSTSGVTSSSLEPNTESSEESYSFFDSKIFLPVVSGGGGLLLAVISVTTICACRLRIRRRNRAPIAVVSELRPAPTTYKEKPPVVRESVRYCIPPNDDLSERNKATATYEEIPPGDTGHARDRAAIAVGGHAPEQQTEEVVYGNMPPIADGSASVATRPSTSSSYDEWEEAAEYENCGATTQWGTGGAQPGVTTGFQSTENKYWQ